MTEERASLNPRPIAAQLPGGGGGGPSPVGPGAAALPEPNPEPNLVGQMLDGRYQVMQRLGEGMLTTVYEARHAGSGRHFALKVLRASLAAKPHVLDRFLQQARAAAQIRHDHVVAIEEFGYTPTQSVYAAVELVVADHLQTILDRDGRWSWSQARPVALQIAAALAAAHGVGIVHRSLRPANCFVVLDPRGKRDPFVKVADFGMAQVGVEASQASPDATTTTLFGDPEYMAPEQGFGGPITAQADIYAFGVLLYRLLAGQVPFSHGNPFQVISQHAQKPVPPLRDADPKIPEAVEQVVMRCLAKAPEQRFASAAQLEQALSAIPGHAQGGAQAPGAAPGAGSSGPRFARMNAGGAGPSPTAVPPKQPSVIVAGSLGDGGGGISGTLGDSSPPAPYDPYGGSIGGGPPPAAPPPVSGPVSPPAYAGSSATSSFLASRPGLRMGLGAAVSSDGPAPPPTIAPGMAVPSPTIAPGSMSAPFPGLGLDSGPPPYAPPGEVGSGPGYPPLGAGPGMPPPSAGPGYPPLGAGPGMPPPASAGPGYPPPSAGPGMPPPSAGPGYPPLGAGPGMPPPSAGPGYPPLGAGSGIPPLSAGPGMPPPSAGPGYPPLGAGSGIPPLSAGPGMPPPGAGPGYPSLGAGSGIPPLSAGPGIPPRDDADLGSGDGLRRGVGPGMPPRVGAMGSVGAGVGPGMPLRSMGPGMPPPERSNTGPNVVPSAAVAPPAESLGAVEYDEDEEPKRRPLLLVAIGLAVILGGVGLALLIARGLEEPEGDVAKVTRTQKAQDVHEDANEPEQPKPEVPDEPTLEDPTPVKKPPPKKAEVTFEQSLASMKSRVKSRCSKLGSGPIEIDTFVDRGGGRANTPKVQPRGPVGDCARKIVEQWSFPASDDDHVVNERVSW